MRRPRYIVTAVRSCEDGMTVIDRYVYDTRTGEHTYQSEEPEKFAGLRYLARRNEANRAKRAAYSDLGMKRTRSGNWE